MTLRLMTGRLMTRSGAQCSRVHPRWWRMATSASGLALSQMSVMAGMAGLCQEQFRVSTDVRLTATVAWVKCDYIRPDYHKIWIPTQHFVSPSISAWCACSGHGRSQYRPDRPAYDSIRSMPATTVTAPINAALAIQRSMRMREVQRNRWCFFAYRRNASRRS